MLSVCRAMEISLLLSAAQSAPVGTSRPDHFAMDLFPSTAMSHQDSTRSAQFSSSTHYAMRPAPPKSHYSLHQINHSHSSFGRSCSLPLHGGTQKKMSKPFRCTIEGCHATFGQKGSLTRHIKSRHEKLRPHLCTQCHKSFSALWTLRVHQRNVHLKSKPHKCHLCDKSFGELFNKSKHIAIVHEGKRPFSCPICSRAFGYKGDMRKHVLELHEQSGRPFQCMVPSCGVKFARKRYLRRHENLSHKDVPKKLESLPSAHVPNLPTVFRKPHYYYDPLDVEVSVNGSSLPSPHTITARLPRFLDAANIDRNRHPT